MSDGGKGSAPRPFSVDQQTFENNWDRIFNKVPEGGMTPEHAEKLGKKQILEMPGTIGTAKIVFKDDIGGLV